ncbi:unnamed protein product, partial [marine sediment metagenome]
MREGISQKALLLLQDQEFEKGQGAFLNSEVEAEILGEIEAVLSMEEVPEDTKDSYREIKEMALDIFTPTKALVK